MKLRDLDALMTVVSAGGVRKAAQHLHLSQPAVSKAIAALEETIGFPLLVRDRQGIALTQYGQSLIHRAAAMFDELEQGLRDLEELADPDSGQISLACPDTINGGLVAAAIDRMHKSFPRVTFGIDSGDPPVLLSRFLLDRLSDFVILRPYGSVIDAKVRAEPLFRERLEVVVAHTSAWAHRRRIRLADLVDATWILSRNESSGDSPVVEAFRNAGLPFPKCLALSGSLSVRYTLLAKGPYVTVIPHSLLRFGRTGAGLKVLPIDVGQWQMPTMILTRADRSLNSTASAFLDIVRELCVTLADGD